VTTSSSRIAATPLGPAFDLLAAYEEGGFFFERDGLGVAASPLSGGFEIVPASSGMRSLARSAAEALRALDRGAAAPIAVGALPFDSATLTMRVPSRAVRRTDGRETWLLDLVRGNEGRPQFGPDRVVGDLPREAFRPVQLEEEPTSEVYAAAVGAAVRRMSGSELEKVVLARTLRVDAGRALDPRRLLHRLRAVEPHCFTFAAGLIEVFTRAVGSPGRLVE